MRGQRWKQGLEGCGSSQGWLVATSSKKEARKNSPPSQREGGPEDTRISNH